jgi:SpoVK/Ycf46/Vps4 family AAA+-type ATPase
LASAKGSLVGQSEGNIRHALATVDALGESVLWLDEIEKTTSGVSSSGQTDGGTVSGMVEILLTWLQEHTTPVVVVATCNRYDLLPPELTRAGRFDERFFLDLPTASEREQIAAVHLRRLCNNHCNVAVVNDIPVQVAQLTDQWTGAEIEQLIKSAARRTNRQLTPASLEAASRDIIPISRTSNIQELRQWASTHLRRANANETTTTAPSTRRRIAAQEVAN